MKKIPMPRRRAPRAIRRTAPAAAIPATSPIMGMPPDYGAPGMPPEPGMMSQSAGTADGGAITPDMVPPKLSSLRNMRMAARRGGRTRRM